jgi:hypothetical protein
MSRFESRTFKNHKGEREKRVVDTLSPNALIPAGSVFTCEAGHEIFDLLESIQFMQLVESRMFGPPRPFQKGVTYGGRLGPCFCGREYAWQHPKNGLHTKEGWSSQRIPRPLSAG